MSVQGMNALQTPSGENRSLMHMQSYRSTTSSCRPKWIIREPTHMQEEQQKSSKNISCYNYKDLGNPRKYARLVGQKKQKISLPDFTDIRLEDWMCFLIQTATEE